MRTVPEDYSWFCVEKCHYKQLAKDYKGNDAEFCIHPDICRAYESSGYECKTIRGECSTEDFRQCPFERKDVGMYTCSRCIFHEVYVEGLYEGLSDGHGAWKQCWQILRDFPDNAYICFRWAKHRCVEEKVPREFEFGWWEDPFPDWCPLSDWK